MPADIRDCKGERDPRNLPDRSSDHENKPPLVLVQIQLVLPEPFLRIDPH